MERKSLIAFFALSLLFTLLSLNASTLTKASSSTIVISEVQLSGLTADDEFIELKNLTNQDINLGDYRLVRRTSSGASDSNIKAFEVSDVIPANGYYLWTGNEWSGAVTPDASTSGVLAANNGIALRLGALNTGSIIDSVAWGNSTNAFVEGTVFPNNPEPGSSLHRLGDDTDNNSVDFGLNAVSDPQNSQILPSSTPTVSPSSSPSPTATPTQTEIPTSTPSATPTSTSTVIPTSTPSANPTPSATVRPGKVLAQFGNRECRMIVRVRRFGFMVVHFPTVVCTRLDN